MSSAAFYPQIEQITSAADAADYAESSAVGWPAAAEGRGQPTRSTGNESLLEP
jgi:hypothetical protein